MKVPSQIARIAITGSLCILAACNNAESGGATAAASSEDQPATPTSQPAAPAVVSLDPSCDAALAERTITQCKACHSATKDAPSMAGPNLFGVYGRAAASLDNFAYSPSMKKSGITWDDKTLDAYLADPKTFVPDNRMAFGGVHDPAARSAVICYMKALK